MAKLVTISNKNTNKCHKVIVTISDIYCSQSGDFYSSAANYDSSSKLADVFTFPLVAVGVEL